MHYMQTSVTQEVCSSYLCLTVDPAALGETALLGDRPEAPTLAELAAGPG